jgi:endonuclease/exonuclease/phosphatase family metal-dependent hydrolase
MGDFNAISLWDFVSRKEAEEELMQYPEGVNVFNRDQGGPKVVTQMEKAGYVDAYARFGAPGANSSLRTDHPAVRIDYIFLSESLVPALTATQIWQEPPGQEASDHRPMIADFDLARLSV